MFRGRAKRAAERSSPGNGTHCIVYAKSRGEVIQVGVFKECAKKMPEILRMSSKQKYVKFAFIKKSNKTGFFSVHMRLISKV